MEEFEKKWQIIEGGIKDKTEIDEKIFQSYVEDLGLKPEDFDKRILDVGAGSARFAKWAKEHHLSSEIYSLEPYQFLAEKEKSVKAFAEKLPFADESFDLVVSVSAIPNIYIFESDKKMMKNKVRDSLLEMARVVKPGGEIRLARVFLGKVEKGRQVLVQSIEEILERLEADENIEIEKIRTPSNDIYQYDKNNKRIEPMKILAESYLIIIRKEDRI